MSATEKRVIEWIKRHQLWQPNQSVALGVSGGVDSMVMLTILARTQRAHKAQLTVVTLNHGLRAESEQECQHVLEAAAGMSLPAICLPLNLQKGPNLQATARSARQAALKSVQCERIATAHHQEDQAETVLYRLLRGSGTIGLSGLAPLNTPWCRPILCLSKNDIVTYANEHNIQWYEDPSNSTSMRGRLRQLMPLLDELHGGSVRALVRSAQICAYDDSLLSDIVDQNWVKVYSDNRLRTTVLRAFKPGLQLRILYRFLTLNRLTIRFEILERILFVLQSERFSTAVQINAIFYLSVTPQYIHLMSYE